jgi:hypothetical protein
VIENRRGLLVVVLLLAGCSNAPPVPESFPAPSVAGGAAGRASAGSGNASATGGNATAGHSSAGSGNASAAGGNASAAGGNASAAGGNASAAGGNASATGGNASAGAGGASSAGAAGGAAVPATLAAVASILSMECGAPLCHGGVSPQQGLNLTNMSTLRASLTSRMVKECNNAALVVPGDPDNSALLMLPTWKCSDPVAGPFVMPQGCIDPTQCLPDNELATFKAWIAAGAPP